MTHIVVMFSGGVGSWGAAKRLLDTGQGQDGIELLFTDTRIEDPDLYRFLDEAAADLGLRLTKIADGRTPWEVFRDRKMLGNSRIAPCSVHLKQKPARQWMERHAPSATVALGIDWTEEHRLAGAIRGWAPFPVIAPLCEPPYLTKPDLLAELSARGIQSPSLYRDGFPHNNCGGGCVRAGAGHFEHLYKMRPITFLEWEKEEEALRGQLGDVSILKDRRGGTTKPFTLAQLRVRIEAKQVVPGADDWGGCGCFLEETEE